MAADGRPMMGLSGGGELHRYDVAFGELRWRFVENDIAEMQRIGVEWTRMGFALDKRYGTDADTARRVGLMEKYGINILGYLNAGDKLPDDLEAYKQWVAGVVAAYPRIRIWEVQNEPNLSKFWKGTAQEYVVLLQAAYEAIKAVDPELQVMLGGLSEWVAEPFIEQMIDAEAWRWADLFGFHPYGRDPQSAATRVRSAQRTMRGTPLADLPMWITEIGFHSAASWEGLPGKVPDEATKARYLVEVFDLLSAIDGVEGPIFWYCFQEDGRTMGFGLMNRRIQALAGELVETVEYSEAFHAYQQVGLQFKSAAGQ